MYIIVCGESVGMGEEGEVIYQSLWSMVYEEVIFSVHAQVLLPSFHSLMALDPSYLMKSTALGTSRN